MAATRVTIEPFEHPARFLALQRAFYRDDPHWVPPLVHFDKARLDRARNPFFAHADVGLFVARRAGSPVGRISTTRDRLHDDFHGDRVGFFGHFEAADQDAAHAMLAHAAEWLRQRGATAMRGPVDLSTNYRCGLLVGGDPGPPMVMMPHNPPHYAGYLESFGMAKAKDLLALDMLGDLLDLGRLERVVRRAAQRVPLSMRTLDLKRFDAEIHTLWQLYNRIWERNWGFVPMSEGEFVAEARDLKSILVPKLTTIAEHDGNAVAMCIGIPDLNVPIRACGGRLFPFGWWTFLRTLRRVRHFRVLTLGVLPEYRKTGVDAVVLHHVIESGLSIGFRHCEASWILEDNVGMLRPLLTAGGREYRRYRVFEMPLGAGGARSDDR